MVVVSTLLSIIHASFLNLPGGRLKEAEKESSVGAVVSTYKQIVIFSPLLDVMLSAVMRVKRIKGKHHS